MSIIFQLPKYRYFIKKSLVSSYPIHSSYAKHMQKNIQWVKWKLLHTNNIQMTDVFIDQQNKTWNVFLHKERHC